MATYVQQLYTGCLAQAAYYLENNGDAAIIDPLRDPQPYLDLLCQRGATLRYVIETHFHADFVSGHRDLAAATGAAIIYGPGATPGYDATIAADNQQFPLGEATLGIIHTPGHTLESICISLTEAGASQPEAVFTGDTLFVGDVGRPDLAVKTDLSREDLARHMYRSVLRLKQLPDDVTVYPGHGAGSACGKHIGKETITTIGQQKRSNYALQEMSEAEFVAQLVDGLDLTPTPQYFFKDAAINRSGPALLDEVKHRTLKPLSLTEVAGIWQHRQATILDTRHATEFAKGHIPGALNIGLTGQYAIWVGTLLTIDTPLLIVADAGQEEESILRLARIGYENVLGYLQGGTAAWQAAGQPVAHTSDISPAAFAERIKTENVHILDVRNVTEVRNNGQLAGATVIPLPELEKHTAELDKDATYYIHCAGGYRSMIAASQLQAQGFRNVVNVQGGFAAIKQAGVPVAEPVAA